jgi:adenylate cyclase
MATETERKFLVKGEFRHLAIRQINITQSYLLKDPFKTIRLRITDDKAYLTIKTLLTGETIARNEWEYQIPNDDADEIIKICLPGKVCKTRYIVPSGRHNFEVDVFHDKNEGLVIAEIELGSEAEKFDIPDWLGAEVTGNPAYYNSYLVK